MRRPKLHLILQRCHQPKNQRQSRRDYKHRKLAATVNDYTPDVTMRDRARDVFKTASPTRASTYQESEE